MARCQICNYCRETDGGGKEVIYYKRFGQDLCSECAAHVFKNTYGNEGKTYDYNPGAGEVPLLDLEEDDADDLSVEGLNFLEEFGVEPDKG